MEPGDIIGHEFMGEIVALGGAVKNRAVGDRVVVSFTMSCGECFFCTRGLYSVCERSNLADDNYPGRSTTTILAG
jgi:threonine dehydrogenase-like Zn-dependent dehydrogenase